MICDTYDCDREAYYRLSDDAGFMVCCSDCAEYLASTDSATVIDRL